MHQIVEEEDPSSVAEELESRLKRFNEQHAGPANTRPLVLSVRDSAGTLIAGLTGEFFWNALYVAVLWVDEPHRGMHYGASLLHRAERIAHERGSEAVYLNTLGFQAPGFLPSARLQGDRRNARCAARLHASVVLQVVG